MLSRRGAPSANTLSPQDSANPPPPASSPALLGLPRSNSPSSGFTQFFSKPSKWFTRSASASRISPNTTEPRVSTGSIGRKHKISRPTDPRPILDTYNSKASKSVVDVSSSRPPGSLDIPPFPSSLSASSSPTNTSSTLGDLRNISRRGWSKSADDLVKMSPANLSPITTSFQEKIAQYRNRSDSMASGISPSSPASPASFSAGGRQPFPTSASPPRSATLPVPGMSTSVSAPMEDTSRNGTQQHVHTRSHSFTPKLSSKLAVPRIGPSSPIRKGSGSSERDFPFKDSEKPTKSSAPELPSLPSQGARPPTTLLAPPVIIEPGQDIESHHSRRASQIVYHSSFISRLTEVNPNLFAHPHAVSSTSLEKGWKPFKMELKGSKLYLYKPPNDRSTAIKELFPSELVSPDQEDDEVEEAKSDDGGTPRARRDGDGTMGRKKRAYWGRRTHPDLVLNDSKMVEKGSFEALIHEMAFATTFVDAEPLRISADDTEGQTGWRDFAVTTLLWLPSLSGQVKFENEFTRCCEYFVTGSPDDEERERARQRVCWLADEYLRSHGAPGDESAWDEWRAETIPDWTPTAAGAFTGVKLPTSTSMLALHTPSPLLGQASPDLGAFSPRPDGDRKMVSLVDVLTPLPTPEGTPPPPASPNRSPLNKSPQSSRSHLHPVLGGKLPWGILEGEGLTRPVLFMLDPHLLARSLTLFHRTVVEQSPEHFTPDLVISPSSSSSPTHLFGSDEQPHWLTKLLLLQILGPDSSGGSGGGAPASAFLASPGRHSEDRPMHTSRTHSRSEVISTWVRIGELCRTSGDECSWRAIAAALCSRPVARLEKAWKRVDPQALAAIESWVYPSADGEPMTVKEPRVTPWGGDMKARIAAEVHKARGEEEGWGVAPLDRARVVFESLRTTVALCPRRAVVPEDELGDDVRRMVAFWKELADMGGGTGSIASKFQRVDQFMSLSLAAEPRRKGLFEPYFWTRPSPGHTPYASLIPLSFPEPLPALTLVDRQQILRGRLDSDPADIRFLPLDERKAGRDITGIKHSGTVIPVFNGELVLVVRAAADRPVSFGGSGSGSGSASGSGSRPSSRTPSRPPSSVMDSPAGEKGLGRTPSIRVKPGSSQGLERKTSVARRNSLPAISQRQDLLVSELSSEPPLKVLVQAGMLNVLVQILVHGLKKVSVSVADDNGEMSLRVGRTRQLFVDHEEFSGLWWNVFRSFVTPLVFFELLRKLYMSLTPSEKTAEAFAHAIKKRSEVLHAIKEWLSVGGGSQDILDDSQLFAALQAFFDTLAEKVIPDLPADVADDADVVQALAALKEDRDTLSQSLILQTMRPHPGKVTKGVSTPVIHMSRTRATTSREPPDVDRVSAEELVESLDAMACAAFSNVSEEDLHIAADILEVQSADRTGWFPQREMPTGDEATEMQTLYSLIQEVEPSLLISEIAQDAVYRLLPPSIRSCIRAYGILRKWLISKIVAPRLGIQGRHRRIELFLQAIEIARLRSFCASSSSHLPVGERPCIRSFVEAVISSALLSVESRLHHRAWQAVTQARGCTCESLAALFAKPAVQPQTGSESLTVDMGWLLERMLEIIASPDVIENALQPGQTVINLDKRRYLCSLITDAIPVHTPRKRAQIEDLIRRGFDRLNHIEREVNVLQFDHRGIKEEAQRESVHGTLPGSASARKPIRPFHKLVLLQLDKNRRDKTLRARLLKERLQEQTRIEKRDEMLTRAMRPRKPAPATQKQQRNKKSMSAFLQFMRPISSAFGADIQPTSLIKRSPSELDFSPSGKPSLVLSIGDARVTQYINTVRSFTFQLDTEDGGHYLFQAMNRLEMNKWIETISRVTKMAAKRRLTYLGNSPKPQLSDHIHDQSTAPSRDPSAVFGVHLAFLIEREAGGEAAPGAIPSVVERCLNEIESRGLSEVGIYRIAGANSEINALKEAFNRNENPIQPDTDIHAVCDLVKTWFRLLPEPVFPASSYFEIIEAAKTEDLDTRLSRIRDVIHRLPQANFDLLRRVAEHLDKVTDFEEHNQMTAEALAIVFSPNLLRNPLNDFGMILANMPHTHKLVKALITHSHALFEDADPEGDVDQDEEDEYDSPIPEEDEEEEEEEEEHADDDDTRRTAPADPADDTQRTSQ